MSFESEPARSISNLIYLCTAEIKQIQHKRMKLFLKSTFSFNHCVPTDLMQFVYLCCVEEDEALLRNRIPLNQSGLCYHISNVFKSGFFMELIMWSVGHLRICIILVSTLSYMLHIVCDVGISFWPTGGDLCALKFVSHVIMLLLN